jgi:hypothetical protein
MSPCLQHEIAQKLVPIHSDGRAMASYASSITSGVKSQLPTSAASCFRIHAIKPAATYQMQIQQARVRVHYGPHATLSWTRLEREGVQIVLGIVGMRVSAPPTC